VVRWLQPRTLCAESVLHMSRAWVVCASPCEPCDDACSAVRMLDGTVTDLIEASSLSLNPQHIDIYSSRSVDCSVAVSLKR
jgi:hypothetical protein